MKKYIVLDLVYTEDEGHECFSGSYEECHDFILAQRGFEGMYRIVPEIIYSTNQILRE
ncbi:MAG: hypothetical protein QM660_11015 [Dysgonomonas sp.]